MHRRGVLLRGILVGVAAAFAGCQPAGDLGEERFGLRYLAPEEAEFLRILNEYRVTNGRAALTSSATINQAAYDHSRDMGVRGYFDHVTPEGRTVTQRMCAGGYEPACTGGTTIGENIAAGSAGAYDTFLQWRGSPGHNENMLSARYRAIGIGRASVGGSMYGWYWTTDFAGIVDVDGCACAPEEREACVTASCGAGARDCDDRCQWSECYVPAAGPEICDGYDNDCDGEVDEEGVCGGCVPTTEVCDGADNDCDGRTDENRVCGSACVPDAATEECDGDDNDCDGVIDDGCPCPSGTPPRPCGVAEGRCTVGEQVCEGDVWSACAGAILPRREICDGYDNDCDGRIDEDVCGAGGSGRSGCAVAPGGVSMPRMSAVLPAVWIAAALRRRRRAAARGPGKGERR